MKKGFTLVELLAVIVILGFVALLTIPAVNDSIKYASEQAYEANIEAIKKAANDWALLNTKLLPKEGGSILVYLQELKANKTIDSSIKNPKTGKYLSNNTSVTISKVDGKYEFSVNIVEIDKKDNSNALALLIGGNIVDYVEVNQEDIEYTVPSAQARSEDGHVINDAVITYQIFKGNELVSEVDTSNIGEYKIIYTVTYENTTGNYEKQVHVIDTTKPVMDIGDNIVCTLNTIPSNLLESVTVTDNSGELITPTVDSKIGNTTGIYYVYYTATDSSGNSITERKEVIVNE